ncbi:MAG: MFS transporter [Granulosicoccus sp.]
MRDQTLSFYLFLRNNMRWLGGGLLLTFCSSFGQTFFISLFAGRIRAEYNLTHGDFGMLYMSATLASAATLVYLGKVLDSFAIARVARWWITLLFVAAVLMSVASNVIALVLALYLLRLFGQGMLSHTAMVAMGRWFSAERGRAVSIATIGHQLGESILPLIVLFTLMFVQWRTLWLLAALCLLLIALPVSQICLSVPRQPSQQDLDKHESGKQWTRMEVIRDMPFWAVCTGVLAPAFIGTSVFFHQVLLGEIKQWSPYVIASSFSVMSLSCVLVGLLTGQFIDKYRASTVLPFFLLPLSLGCILLAIGNHPIVMPLFMLLLGCSYGVASAVFGAIWPEIYGTRHLGSIRALVSAAMVFASALGPGLTGWLIDLGFGFESQLLVMSAYALTTMLVLFRVARVLRTRAIGLNFS